VTGSPPRPDYGIDAPGVVRNLFLVAAIGLALWVATLTGLWSGEVQRRIGGINFILPLGHMGPWLCLSFTFTGVWMVWSSKVGKRRERERLLDRIAWSGHERVLDVGCGRGLMLVAAARRLTDGTATGIDIWQSEDLSGNNPGATLENAVREGVRERVEVRTADMRKMPFPDATFDVVVSRAAIHNLYKPADRAKAIAEVARVLKPGAHALIADIRHGAEYTAAFAAHGCRDVRHVESRAEAILTAIITVGSLRPATLVVRKDAAP
jgi:SAM-dependent methyltransferase